MEIIVKIFNRVKKLFKYFHGLIIWIWTGGWQKGFQKRNRLIYCLNFICMLLCLFYNICMFIFAKCLHFSLFQFKCTFLNEMITNSLFKEKEKKFNVALLIMIYYETSFNFFSQFEAASTTTVAPAFNCFPNPCFNGGVCTSKGCICSSGYSGQFCETLSSNSIFSFNLY